LFHEQYLGRKVLVTGHTGFKGSWLALWLSRLGAKVVGYARSPETSPNHWELLKLNSCQSILADLRDQNKLAKAISDHQPEIVFHLAAQPLVRRSYREPHETFSTNVMGTLNVFEAAIASRSVRAIVCVTSDKVYENQESPDGYQESDRLGGADPYSASKACTEILASCYSRSFFQKSKVDGGLLLATVRAGNVIGGGDWSEDRLIPDAVRAVVSKEKLGIRNPESVRPWQHVLEPLSGYLAVGQKLLEGDSRSARAWNFGPELEGMVRVDDVIRCFQESWPDLQADISPELGAPKETKLLRLDSSLAARELNWKPLWDWQTAVSRTAQWYEALHKTKKVNSAVDLDHFLEAANRANAMWVK
jgi:CDP-glucose 4,6-dehydratase